MCTRFEERSSSTVIFLIKKKKNSLFKTNINNHLILTIFLYSNHLILSIFLNSPTTPTSLFIFILSNQTPFTFYFLYTEQWRTDPARPRKKLRDGSRNRLEMVRAVQMLNHNPLSDTLHNPRFFFQQPTHPSFYNTQQPNFGYFQNLLSMDAPPQSPAFDPYAYRSPQVPSTRGNVERPLPIHDDEDDEVVPETQNLGDDDEEDEYNVDEDAGNEEDEAREKKGKR
ncbi:hypothetical protein HanPSC8_Chr14g0625801 [Helianthus annuus]|nr:hypothetical protein HanPSC8_Chr14g0625801 [Helianthus annuus]